MSNKVKTGIFIAGFTAFTLAALYPVIVYPKLHPEVYSKSRFTSQILEDSIFYTHTPYERTIFKSMLVNF